MQLYDNESSDPLSGVNQNSQQLMTSLSDYHLFILYFNNIDVRMFQVYFQLDSQREVVRTLRRLLKEKFADSTQDCPRDAFVENQEVIVKWKDDEWARAR